MRGRTRENSRLGRRSRAIAIAVFVTLVVQANGEAAVAVGSHVDTGSPMALLEDFIGWVKGATKPPPGPAQESGTAAGKDSRVSAEATDGKGGRGRARGKGKNELGEFKRKARDRKAFNTGPGMQPGNGFDRKTAKRKPGLSTAYSDTMEDSGGRLEKKLSTGRMNYKMDDGTFAPIDTELEQSKGRYRQKANDATVELAGKANDPSFAMVAPDDTHSVSTSIEGASAAPAKVDGTEATYKDVMPGVDVRMVSLDSGLKESIVVKSADTPTTFLFPLALNGLTARLAKSGDVEYVDADGKVVAFTPRGFMTDSNIDSRSGLGARSLDVTYKLITAEDGGVSLKVSIDKDWIADPARKFPVLVDPSLKLASSDTWVDKSQPGTFGASDEALSIGSYDNGTTLARALMAFSTTANPLKNPPVGQHTTAASLNIFLTFQFDCGSYPLEVRAIRGTWTASTTTTYPGPALSASGIGSATPAPGAACSNDLGDPNVGTWVSIPLTASVFDSWESGNYGLAVKAPVDASTTSWKRFASANTPVAAKKPYVSITYAPNVAPQVDSLYPDNDTPAYSLRPELMATGHDPDAYPSVELRYQFQLFDDAGAKIADSGLLQYGVRAWKPPANLLKWNRSYGWVALAQDGALNSPAPPPAFFTTTVPQPLITSTLGQNSEQGFDPNIGNYTTSETDAQITGLGPPLAVERSYNSRDPRLTGAFGAGWSSVYDLRAAPVKDSAGAVIGALITYPDGVQVGFGRNPDTSWVPPLGRFATLASTNDTSGAINSFELTDKSGTVFIFKAPVGGGAVGISQIIDARGFIETFTYTGSQLSQVKSASGRTLSFTWQPTGTGGSTAPHVASVSTDLADPVVPASAQVWTYAYTGDRLDKACPPGSTTVCSGYQYATGSGYSTAILNANPRSYLRLRDAAGTTSAADAVVNNQSSLNGAVGAVAFGSAAGPVAGGATTAGTFNGTSSVITVPSDVADNASSQSISLWFKAPASAVDKVLYGFQSAAGSAATTAGFYSPALYIGTDGKLRGQFYSDGATVPITTAAAVTNDAWHSAVLTVDAGTQKLYLDGALVGTLAGQPANTLGRPVATIGAGYLGGLWPGQSHYSGSNFTGYRSSFTGQIAEVADFAYALSAADITSIQTAATRSLPLLTKATTPAGRVAGNVEYDLGAATVTAVTDLNGGRWQIRSPKVTGSSIGYKTAVLLSNPASYWRLADQAGTQAFDDAALNYADYDNVTLGAVGPFGAGDVTAATFNGSTSKVRTPLDLADNNGNLSVSMWFKTTTADRVLYSYSADLPGTTTSVGNYTPALYIDTAGKLRGLFYNGTKNAMTTPAAVTDGSWHQVVMTAAGNTQSLYLDGMSVDSRAGTVNVTGQPYNIIGAGFLGSTWPAQSHYSTTSALGYPSYFNGQIAEVATYRFALTPAQIAAQRTAYTNALSDSPLKYIDVVHPPEAGDPTERVTSNAYDPVHYDRVVRVRNTLGNTTDYGYDTAGFQLTVTDANGNLTATGHDLRGNVSSYTSCQDNDTGKCSTEYYTYIAPSGLTDPRADRILTHRDGRSLDGADDRFKTSYTYNDFGDVLTITTPGVLGFPSGRVSATTYTAGTESAVGGGTQPARLVASTKTPAGATQTFSYFANGDLAATTTPLGETLKFVYDGLGRVATKTSLTDSFALGLVTAFTYDGRDQVLTQTDPPLIQQGTETTPVGNAVSGVVHQARTSYIYDSDGHPLSETIADLTGGDAPRTLSWIYNTAGRPETYTDARGKSTTYLYNPYGQKIQQSAPDGLVTQWTYDSEGRPWRTLLKNFTGSPNNPSSPADLVLESRAYDPAGRLATLTDSMGWETRYTYLDNGLPQSVQRRNPTTGELYFVESDDYDTASNLTERVTNNGTTTTRYVVDEADRVVREILDPDGLARATDYTHNADDFITKTETSQSGSPAEVADAKYDPLGNLTERTVHVGSALRTTVWTRDRRGLLTRAQDPNGAITDYINDSAGNAITMLAPQVNAEVGDGSAPGALRPMSRTGYNTFGDVTETKDPNGNVTVTTYDGGGNPETITGAAYTPAGGTELRPKTTRVYNSNGQLITEIDPLGHQSDYVYDQLGDLTKVSAPGSAVTTFTYDTNGDQLSSTTPTGAQSQATYDFLGRRVTSSVLLRNPVETDTTTYAYGPDGRLATETTPSGVATKYAYDPAGQVTSIVDGANKSTRLTYDLRDRPRTRTLADGTSSVRTYNEAGDLIATADRKADATVIRSTSAIVDNNGWVTSAKDARGTSTSLIRDTSGLVTSQIEPTGTGPDTVTSFGYDAAGNRTRFTDGRGNAFLTTYNSWNLPASRVEPATPTHPAPGDRTWTWSYDAAARPVTAAAPGGVTRTRSYDDRNNLTGETGSGAEASTAARSFGYDLDDRLTSMSAPGSGDSFTYDDRGALRATTGGSGTASFAYDTDGRMSARTDAAGLSAYTYDTAGRPATITDAASATTQTFGYNALSQVESVSYGAGKATRTYTYDEVQRLRTDTTKAPSTGTVTAKIAYDYDNNDNLTAKTTTGLAGASVNTYTYDLANRLASWNNGATTTAYSYDGAGNRTGIGNQTLLYDARNRLTSKTSPAEATTYAYTPRGTRASAMSTPTGGSATTVNSVFDAFDQLLTDQAPGASGGPVTTTTNTYDAAGRVVTTGPSGGTQATLSYTGLDNTLVSDGTNTYSRDALGALVGVGQAAAGGGTVPGSGSLALTDTHTDVVATIDAATGAVRGSAGFDPLGAVTARVGTLAGRLGYQSELTDPLTGKVDMFSRWFDPASGQFSSRDAALIDPSPVSAAANGYGYLEGNPFAGTDPSGNCCGPIHFSAPKIPNPFPALISAVSTVYNKVIVPIGRAIVTGVKAVGKSIAAVGQKIGSTISNGAAFLLQQAKEQAQRIADAAKKAKEKAVAAAAKAKRIAEKVAERARKEAVRVAKIVKKAEAVTAAIGQRLEALGSAVTAGVTQAVSANIKAQLGALKATAQFVDTHRAAIAGIAVGLALGVGCEVASLGAATPACFVAAGAAASAVTTAVSGDTSLKGLAISATIGAAITLATLGVGAVAGPAIRTGLSRLGGTAATRFAAQIERSILPAAANDAEMVGVGAARSAATREAAEATEKGGQTVARQAARDEQQTIADDALGCNSFTAATPVLMADGSRKPIEEVAVGDTVLATDPVLGKNGSEPVTALIRHGGNHTMVEITLENGSTITATDHHPFWIATTASFLDAIALHRGQQLQTPDGDTLTIASTKTLKANLTAYNLTVGEFHTYYVLAGTTPVLVHNAGCGPQSPRNFLEPTNPAQHPPALADLPEGFTVRTMGPTFDYPTGYFRVYNGRAQAVDPSTLKPPSNVTKAEFNARTHTRLPED